MVRVDCGVPCLNVLSTCTTLASSLSPAVVVEEETSSFFFPRTSSINSEGFSINLRNPASGSSLPFALVEYARGRVLSLKGSSFWNRCAGYYARRMRCRHLW